ncbi:membrane protease regulatory membrane protein [Paenibacillus harenae]|uniref:membrane protease regulatory membrane protein n=1 Tax=Paenibacillus harenae TaxID=306543 RepID=UPI0004140E8F|nr:membrane protease regulatory membrane protein [Paenibacillus harenae]
METLFWACLIGGIIYAVISVVFGDWLGLLFDGALDFLSLEGHSWLSPMSFVGGITVFGGAGILFERYSGFGITTILILSLLIAILAGVAVFFLYVRPMENSESSIAFSLHSLPGMLAEVLVPIPASGYGEVMVKVGAGFTNQIAASFDKVDIAGGSQVVVVEVKDSTLYVSEVHLDPLLK